MMKEVIKQTKELPYITLDKCTKGDYYGVSLNNGRYKGFISQEKFNAGRWLVIAKSGLTFHNNFPFSDSSTLLKLIINILDCSETSKVFWFDTPGELFKWLAKD